MMKPRSGKYDQTTKVLRLFGKESGDAPIDIQLDNPNQFLAWLGSVLFAEVRDPTSTEAGFHATQADYAIGGSPETGFSLGFTFVVGQARMTYYLPVASRSREKVIDAASRLGKALADLVPTPQKPAKRDTN